MRFVDARVRAGHPPSPAPASVKTLPQTTLAPNRGGGGAREEALQGSDTLCPSALFARPQPPAECLRNACSSHH